MRGSCVLKGAVVFFSDLIRELGVDNQVEFMAISSYGSGTVSSGNGAAAAPRPLLTPVRSAGRNRLEAGHRWPACVDRGGHSGHRQHAQGGAGLQSPPRDTAQALLTLLNGRHPASLKTAVLLHKKECTTADVSVGAGPAHLGG